MKKGKKGSNMDKCMASAPMILRIVVGLVFFVPGIMKLMSLIQTGDHMVSGLLGGAVWLAWILAIVEIVAGAMVILGKKQCLGSVLLGVILIVAIILTQAWTNPGNFLWHLLGLAALFQVLASSPSCMKK